MKKKVLSFITAAIISVTFIPVFSFAVEEEPDVQDEPEVALDSPEDYAEVIEDILDTDDVVDDVVDEGDFVVEGESSEIVIPEEGDGEIHISSCDEDSIAMSLPNEFSNTEGELTSNGTIVYAEDDADAGLAVQAIQEQQGDICLDGFRSLVTIENTDAPHDYSFEFDLTDGAKLVQDGDYINIINENNMISDENGDNPEPELIGVIEPAWAKDVNGDSVSTHYSINGNTLTQTVEFDENSQFPIVADPTTKKPASKKVGVYNSSYKLSHAAIGLGITSGAALTKPAKKKIEEKLAAKVGGKFVPIVGWATLTVDLYCAYASFKGHPYTKFTVKYEVWTRYKHQGGNWIKGYYVKVKKITAKWSD